MSDVFDAAQADFTPLFAGQAQTTLFCADHAARVTVDEEGCKAAAYTVMMLDGASPLPGETVDFVLDRPFVFAITGADGSLLFAGVVEQP